MIFGRAAGLALFLKRSADILSASGRSPLITYGRIALESLRAGARADRMSAIRLGLSLQPSTNQCPGCSYKLK